MTGVLYLLLDVARPLRKLEDAVSRVGEDINREPVPEQGSAEVRRISRRFNAMVRRLAEGEKERHDAGRHCPRSESTPHTAAVSFIDAEAQHRGTKALPKRSGGFGADYRPVSAPVSYTHLTLPTICSV